MRKLALVLFLLSSSALAQGIGGSGISGFSPLVSLGPGYINVFGGINFNNQINFGASPGTVNGPANSWLWASPQNATGVCALSPGIQCNLTYINFIDQVNISSNNSLTATAYQHVLQSPATGNRQLGQFQFWYQGSSDTNKSYSAITTVTKASASNGGSSLSQLGALFGLNPYVVFSSGATFWAQGIGEEIDLSLRTGASAREMIGLQIVQDSLFTISPLKYVVALSFNNQAAQGSVVGHDALLQDGAYAGYPSLKSTGVIYRCYPTFGAGNCGTIGGALDLSNYTSASFIVNGPSGTYQITGGFGVNGSTLQAGSGTPLTLNAGDIGMSKVVASNSAPGASGARLELVCGTNAGSAQLIAYAGTSITSVSIKDNIGFGVTGC